MERMLDNGLGLGKGMASGPGRFGTGPKGIDGVPNMLATSMLGALNKGPDGTGPNLGIGKMNGRGFAGLGDNNTAPKPPGDLFGKPFGRDADQALDLGDDSPLAMGLMDLPLGPGGSSVKGNKGGRGRGSGRGRGAMDLSQDPPLMGPPAGDTPQGMQGKNKPFGKGSERGTFRMDGDQSVDASRPIGKGGQGPKGNHAFDRQRGDEFFAGPFGDRPEALDELSKIYQAPGDAGRSNRLKSQEGASSAPYRAPGSGPAPGNSPWQRGADQPFGHGPGRQGPPPAFDGGMHQMQDLPQQQSSMHNTPPPPLQLEFMQEPASQAGKGGKKGSKGKDRDGGKGKGKGQGSGPQGPRAGLHHHQDSNMPLLNTVGLTALGDTFAPPDSGPEPEHIKGGGKGRGQGNTSHKFGKGGPKTFGGGGGKGLANSSMGRGGK
mmetsp:Transcript_133675/g.231877  ORF Transcript_133675/g.231877 Transcript_133675/m.231877 type:complete len:433 (+) Transcript_133675:665-1963(+)